MNIEEHKLIVEFLGYPIINDDKLTLTNYSENWNGLMEVVNHIESLETEFDGRFGVYIHSNCCSIQSTKLDTRPESPHYSFAIFDICLDTKIESVYYVALQFITWWNQNHKK